MGTWIEIELHKCFEWNDGVVPHVGTWIEIQYEAEEIRKKTQSFPTWERGLKLGGRQPKLWRRHVVPHVGTWIEIYVISAGNVIVAVVPHVGTWIEIMFAWKNIPDSIVVPHVGTWIEMLSES